MGIKNLKRRIPEILSILTLIGSLCLLSGCSGAAKTSSTETSSTETSSTEIPDGEYRIDVALEGGSGKATVTSPCALTVENGEATAAIEWSSSHYDYMKIDGEKYLPVNEDGNSVFEIPVTVFDEPMDVIADTTAMSEPHEIEYTLTFDSASMVAADSSETESETNAAAEDTSEDATGDASAAGADTELSGSSGLFSATNISVADHSTDISDSLTYTDSMTLQYATQFSVDNYEGGYALVTIEKSAQFLVVPEGMEAPEDLSADITVLQQPISNVCMAGSATMDMYVAMDALDSVSFAALDADSWYLDEVKAAMEAGSIVYAGKYSAPDYELIVSGGCGLVVENTMIYHNPEVKEKLEDFGIPVLVDYSSYESDPIGRMEWVKLYGVLENCREQANAAFEEQAALFEAETETDTETENRPTVAFFYINSSGAVNVRKSNDYLPKMIEFAGGDYIFEDLGTEDATAKSTVTMQMEEFYAAAKDADYLIYNSSIAGELGSVDDLLAQSSLLKNFKAVQENHVYCTSKNLYQSSMELGSITADIRKALAGEEELTYLYHLE